MYQLLNKKKTDNTSEAWEDFQKRQILYPPKPIKVKKPRKRQSLPLTVKIVVESRSGGICEEVGCNAIAKAKHHLLSVSKYPELQFQVENIIHICILHHRMRHPSLPDKLFYAE